MTRREAIALLSAAPAALWDTRLRASRSKVSLGFSLYGMKGVPLSSAVRTCAAIGYDSVELCLMPGWSEPDSLSTEARRSLSQQLQAKRLSIAALMEEIYLLDQYMPKQTGLERLRKAAALGHDLSHQTPLIETVIGGKTSDWESGKYQMAERLGEWASEASRTGALLCIKAHAGAAVDTPEKLLWLYHQVNFPSLKLTYDYSHYQVAGLPLKETLEAVLPYCSFIHVKDAKGDAAHPQFLLAGDGELDYATYFRLLKQAGYSGPIVAEVSAQLQHVASYDPAYAARHCYECLSGALAAAQLERTRSLA
jgi:sugar phosphate isomerase/epimerase